ncbi:MAG: hypothetical protein RL557_747 [archaeon]|jgi:epoxide hydrolase-like predicted phosphatase
MAVKKKEIKAIVFDIGSVVTKPEKMKDSEVLAKTYKINRKKFLKAILNKWDKMIAGKISMKDYYNSITKQLKIKGIGEFERRWKLSINRRTEINKSTQSLIKDLKKNYKTIAFTNVSKDFKEMGIKKGIYKFFDMKICSCDEGMKKPRKNFYELLLKRAKHKPQEMIFIDDKKPNLMPAQTLGIQTIHFKNAKQLKKDLKNRGVKL